ncbi:DUF4242 domain-containing protein [Rhodocytophaga rosea]|uniref:DUF4242 domain-containing protein n=1 Tax=Rhodocytophaga rosea TaxID=2704465 RepID=A0A6C0GQ96_9BACT|nr:DUF4242 domain-containing protein [Rhodocytophaga rosea]QHT70246.1 DUF4242 domain-containing protein [Rhodocytophaga rosea]
MKTFVKVLFTASIYSIISFHLFAQSGQASISSQSFEGNRHLYIDVHQLQPGKVKFEGVAEAHAKDLAVQSKYGVQFLKYWVDEQKGLVYCLSSASDSASIRKTHAEAHGLLPAYTYQVTDGPEAIIHGKGEFYLDVYELGAGKVTAKDVAAAHEKDLAVQQKYGVNFINYWVDENSGTVMCLSEAKNSTSVIHTHKEAHGLVPAYVLKVKQGE